MKEKCRLFFSKTKYLILLLVIALLIFAYGEQKVTTEYASPLFSGDNSSYTKQLFDGDEVETVYTAGKTDVIKDLRFCFITYGVTDQPGSIHVTVCRRGMDTPVLESDIPASSIQDWGWITVMPRSPISVEKGEEFEFTLRAVGFTEQNAMSVVLADGENMAIRAKWSKRDHFQNLYIVFAVMLLLLLAFGFYLLYEKKIRLSRLLPVTLAVMFCMFTILIPADLGTDEGAHMNFVYQMAEKLQGYDSGNEQTIVVTKEESKRKIEIVAPDHAFYNKYLKTLVRGEKKEGLGEWHRDGSLENPSVTYVPAAVGLIIGRSLHLSAPAILTMARLFSFLAILALLTYAIARIPVAKELLFVLCLFPIMLQQISTINVDGIDIAMAFALFAAVLKIRDGTEGKMRFADYAIAVLTSLVLSRCKFGALLPVCFVMLIVFFAKRKSEKKEDRIVALAALVLPFVCLLVGFLPVILRSHELYSGTLWSDHYSIGDLLSNPAETVKLLLNTIFTQLDFYYLTLGGAYLSWLNVILPQHLIWIFMAFLAITVFRKAGETPVYSGKTRILFAVLSLLGIGFAVGGMLIGWTPRDSNVIQGVQGRYFLPFLPMLLLSIRPNHLLLPENSRLRTHAVMAALFMQIPVIVALFVRAV